MKQHANHYSLELFDILLKFLLFILNNRMNTIHRKCPVLAHPVYFGLP